MRTSNTIHRSSIMFSPAMVTVIGLLVSVVFLSTVTPLLVDARRVSDATRFAATPVEEILQQPFRFTLVSSMSPSSSGVGSLVDELLKRASNIVLPFIGAGAGVSLSVTNNSARLTGKSTETRRSAATGLPLVDFTELSGNITFAPSSADEESATTAAPPSFMMEALVETYYPAVFAEDSDEERRVQGVADRRPESMVSRSAITLKIYQLVVKEESGEVGKELIAAWGTSTARGSTSSNQDDGFCTRLTSPAKIADLTTNRLSVRSLSMRMKSPGAFEAKGRYCIYDSSSNNPSHLSSGIADLTFINLQEATVKIYAPAGSSSSFSAFPIVVGHIFSKRSILDTTSFSQMIQRVAAPTTSELIFDDVHTLSGAPNTFDGVPQTYIMSLHGKQQRYLSEYTAGGGDSVVVVGAEGAAAASTTSTSGSGVMDLGVLGLVSTSFFDSFLPDTQTIFTRIDNAALFLFSFYTWSCENWHLLLAGLGVFMSKMCMSVIQAQKDKKDMIEQKNAVVAAAKKKDEADKNVEGEISNNNNNGKKGGKKGGSGGKAKKVEFAK